MPALRIIAPRRPAAPLAPRLQNIDALLPHDAQHELGIEITLYAVGILFAITLAVCIYSWATGENDRRYLDLRTGKITHAEEPLICG